MASESITRRSANYHKTIWDHQSIHSITSNYSVEQQYERLEKLKNEVKLLLESKVSQEPPKLTAIIDSIRRLGVAYHFDKEIKEALKDLYAVDSNDLFEVSLRFRLLRQYGFNMSADIFNRFKNQEGNFQTSLTQDVKGLLSLYDASFLGVDGENILDEAKSFTKEHLEAALGKLGGSLADEVERALKTPLNWRAERLGVRCNIDEYEKEEGKNQSLLELAKLDFNILQTLYQNEIKELARWWKELGLHGKLSFARDRLVESYLWGVEAFPEPQFSESRKVMAKLVALFSVLDDIYDLYGSLEEVELLTKAFERWNLNALQELPHYMKLCYSAIFNFFNEISYIALKKHELDATEILKDEWRHMCKAKVIEARWYHQGHKPTLEEHISVTWTSLGVVPALLSTYLVLDIKLEKEAIAAIRNKSKLLYWTSVVLRLCNDVGTGPAELERGDVHPATHCHMHEKGVGEESALEHINNVLCDAWKKLNEECKDAPNLMIPSVFVDAAVNLARCSHFFYEDGDGFGVSHGKTKEHITSLLVEPIPL